MFGSAPVAHLELADEYSNRVFHWLNIGVVAFSNPRNLRVHAIEFLFAKPPYWKGVEFCGRIIVAGSEIAVSTPVSALESFGFQEEQGTWKWRSGCSYVLAETDGADSITAIAIGVEQEKSVLPALLQRAAKPCK